MIRRFCFRYDTKHLYEIDDLIEFLNIAVRINNDPDLDTVITLLNDTMTLTYTVKNSYTNIPTIERKRSVLNELLKT